MYRELSDEELMKKVAANQLNCLNELFERHHRHVFNFLHKMSGDSSLSEDIAQEVFYKILKYRSSYREGRFLPWMFTIARNSLTTYYRNDKIMITELNLEDCKHLPEENSDYEEEVSDLQRALDQLSLEDKELLVLHKLQNVSHKDIAEILGSTPGAVKSKTSRALKKLREIYFKSIENEI